MFEPIKAYCYCTSFLLIGLLLFLKCAKNVKTFTSDIRLITLLVFSQAVAFLSPSILAYNIVALLIVPIFATSRRLIAPIYIFTIFTLPLLSVVLHSGGIYLLSYDVGISLTLGALAALLKHGDGRHAQSLKWDASVFLLVVLFVLTTGRGSTVTNLGRLLVEQSLQLLGPYYVISRSIRSRDDLESAVYGLVAAGAALSMLAVFEAVHTWPLYRITWSHYGIPLGSGSSVKLRGGLLRSPGPYPEPTSFAFVLTVAFLATYIFSDLFKSKGKHLALLALMTVGLCAPQSRGAWIGALIGMAAYQTYQRRYAVLGSQLFYVALGLVGLVATSLFSPKLNSILNVYGDLKISKDYRADLLTRGVEEVMKYPVLGRPVPDVMFALRDLTQGEGIVDFVNSYLFVSLIGGLVGLTVLITALGVPMLATWRLRRRILFMRTNGSAAAFAFSVASSVVVMLGFTSLGGRTTTMLIVVVALMSIVLNEAAKLRLKRPADKTDQPVAIPEAG